MNRAYAVLEVKAFDSDARKITGIATTPTPDRAGDVVEPLGVSFKNPLPLLWQHNSREPVGQAKFKKPTKAGVEFEAQIFTTEEGGRVKERLDEAWQSVKLGLVRGVSIGFRPLGEAYERMKEGGIRFLETEVLELSLVTIPANQDATILSIKSIDQTLRAAHGTQVTPKSLPGASGQPATPIPKGKAMTNAERLAALENKRAANVARMSDIDKKATVEEGRTFNAEETEEFDTLASEVKSIDEQLQRTRLMIEFTKAQPVQAITQEVGITMPVGTNVVKMPQRENSGITFVKPNIEPGIKMARWAMSLYRARGNMTDALSIYQSNKRWMDTAPEVSMVMKTAVAAGDTTTSGWASELVYAQNIANEFIE
jgi:HK97 family phage prohead protease